MTFDELYDIAKKTLNPKKLSKKSYAHPLQKKYPDSRITLIILKSQGKIIGEISYCDFNTIYNLDVAP